MKGGDANMADPISYQCMLLSRMSSPYRDELIAALGLDAKQVAALASRSARYPDDLNCSRERLVELLGAPTLGDGVVGSAGASSNYLMPFWPHLRWSVVWSEVGWVRNTTFENQVSLVPLDCDPAFIRPGVWTRPSVERVARTAKLYDGWEELAVVRCEFERDLYEGEFVFGILQSWKRIA